MSQSIPVKTIILSHIALVYLLGNFPFRAFYIKYVQYLQLATRDLHRLRATDVLCEIFKQKKESDFNSRILCSATLCAEVHWMMICVNRQQLVGVIAAEVAKR